MNHGLLETFADARNFAYSERWIRQRSTYTFPSSTTNEQQLFNATTNGALTVPVGIFLFGSVFSISSMNATSGNAAFGLLGAGTATLAGILYFDTGLDNASAQVAALSGGSVVQSKSPASAVTAAINTAMQMQVFGTFEVTAAGTIIPSISLKDAASAVVAVGSFFWCRQIGPAAAVSYGAWT